MKEINRRWFSMKAEGDAAEISIFDEIGAFGVNVGDFKKEFDAIKDSKAITLYLNSPGGDVFAGMAIYNLMAPSRAKITVKILGLAASVASVIALVGQKRPTMAEGAYFMIHNAWTIAIGDAAELRKTASLLDGIDGNMAALYVDRTGRPLDEIKALMNAETWMTGEEAVEAGFAEGVEEAEQIAALADLSKFGYQRTPRAVLDRIERKSNPPATARDLEALLREAGYSRTTAAGIVSKGFSAVRAGGSDEEGAGSAPTAEEAASTSVLHFTPQEQRDMDDAFEFLSALA